MYQSLWHSEVAGAMVDVVVVGVVKVVVVGFPWLVPLRSGKEQFGEQWHSPLCKVVIFSLNGNLPARENCGPIA